MSAQLIISKMRLGGGISRASKTSSAIKTNLNSFLSVKEEYMVKQT